jgi:hypothetical protein
MNLDLKLLNNRHDASPAELSEFVASNFGGNLLTLRQLEPFITEIKRRFKILPRNAAVDGSYKTIGGHRSFKSWCHGVLGRTDRTVRYMISKSKKEEQKPAKEAETISAVLNRCQKYIAKQKLDEPTKDAILRILWNHEEQPEHIQIEVTSHG